MNKNGLKSWNWIQNRKNGAQLYFKSKTTALKKIELIWIIYEHTILIIYY